MNWSALFSLRVWGGAFVVGFIACILPALVFPPLGTVAFALAFGWVLYYQVTSGTPVICPHCHKRVKIGATTCRFCGRDTR